MGIATRKPARDGVSGVPCPHPEPGGGTAAADLSRRMGGAHRLLTALSHCGPQPPSGWPAAWRREQGPVRSDTNLGGRCKHPAKGDHVDVRAWNIRGGKPLAGEIHVGGSKYSALPAIPAMLLADGASVLHNVPQIRDVHAYLDMLVSCGAAVQQDGADLRLDPQGLRPCYPPPAWSAALRASTYMLAVQLALWGTAQVGLPGGDRIGTRPLDLHIKALTAMGADIGIGADGMLRAQARRLHGAHIYLDQPSVGATVQVMLAAVRAEGETRLENAYVAPFVVDLANMLGAMGAEIHGAGTSRMRIVGRSRLYPTEHTLIGDQAEAFIFLAAGAATRGRVRAVGIDQSDVGSGLAKLREAGAEWAAGPGWVEVSGPERLRAVDAQTGPLPAFYTDYHPPLAAALATASGVSRLVETVWPERFSYAEGLRAMGADIRVDGNAALVRGGRLRGSTVQAGESRAVAAYAIAACAASGDSLVTGVEHVDRVCGHFVAKLQELGAAVAETVREAAAGCESSAQRA